MKNAGGHTSKWGPPQLLLSRESPRYARVVQGVKVILEEQGFLEQGNLWAEHPNFKCEDPEGACCCYQILFNQPDFQAQKLVLFELVEANGHIAFFYPKFHCELNWGAAKYHYRMLPLTHNEAQMEKNI